MQLLDFNSYVNESLKQEMKLPADVLKISELFHEKEKKLYVVGGAVRDYLQDKAPKDFDLATDATPDESLEILRPYFKTMEVGRAFGVVVAITRESPDGIEIATFRKDEGKGRRPDAVEFTSIENDVLRRDLTINALFYDIQSKEIVDLVGGIKDIRNKTIRTVGDPIERFDEDPLRKLRAIRFACRMGGKLDTKTLNALKSDPSLNGVSPERIRDEFMKILATAKSTAAAVSMLDKLDFLELVFPGLKLLVNDVVQGNPLATIALVLRENTPSDLFTVLNKLTYSRDEVSAITFLNKLQKLSVSNAYELKKVQERSSLRSDAKTVLDFCEKVMSERLAKAFSSYRISTTGGELERKGFSGEKLGEKLKEMETEKFKEHLRTK